MKTYLIKPFKLGIAYYHICTPADHPDHYSVYEVNSSGVEKSIANFFGDNMAKDAIDFVELKKCKARSFFVLLFDRIYRLIK